MSTLETTHRTVDDDETSRYLVDGHDFIDDGAIHEELRRHANPDPTHVREITAKALKLQRLDPPETAALLNVQDETLWQEMFDTGREIKNKVYGPRVVVFAPLYCSNLCTNSCTYCGFRAENSDQVRRRLSTEDVRSETEALIAKGHKRLIVVYGEHPSTGIDYITDTIRTIYATKSGVGPDGAAAGEIRRVNVNAAPMSIEDLRRMAEVGIGTFQVFQETYHHDTYRRVHPRGPKSDYRWRLYALHRAQEAGIDDVGIGALFGLYDWRFEVMGLLHHTIDLEERFNGVGPHTISFPRLEPAQNAPITVQSRYGVSDSDFRRVIAVLRLSVPYTGMIVTAREKPEIRRAAFELGCTQTDASTRIGVGAYSERGNVQELGRQQFMLGDMRELDDVVREFSEMGQLTSFCTAGYRCGRTGDYFMGIAKQGKTHHFCIPNAILTLTEYLLDYASPQTREAGMKVIESRLAELPEALRPQIRTRLEEIKNGKRDVFV
ncbi:MAG: [FeFe] hydrogenase H-cluster radical SAM maturase HydG [Planctomycetota bacterium]